MTFHELLGNTFTKNDVICVVDNDEGLDYVVVYDGLEYLSYFYSLLHSTKSFLDIFSRLLVKMIIPSADITFSKALVEGKSLSGGKLCNWLEKSAPASCSYTIELRKLIIEHSTSWITKMVNYRDMLTHREDISDIVNMHIKLEMSFPPFPIEKINVPLIGDQLLGDYSKIIS